MAFKEWWQRNSTWLELIGLTVVWPVAAYAVATWGDYTVDRHAALAVGLAISGLIAWVARNH